MTTRRRGWTWALAAFVLVSWVGSAMAEAPVKSSDAAVPTSQYPFAKRLEGLKGVSNVGQIAPGLYRGSSPNEDGLDSLKALGVRTVVNLRHYHGSTEERRCRERGLEYVRVATASSDEPKDEDVHRFLAVVTDPARQPVYFHCLRGKDRTGVMCAVYRMGVEGWPLEAALAEMQAFGFFDGWHDLMRYVEGFPARKDRVWPTVH